MKKAKLSQHERLAHQPFNGKSRTVDQLISRLAVLEQERKVILDELQRQHHRAGECLDRNSV